MSVEFNPANEKSERWKRSFFTIDNKSKPLLYKQRTEDLKKTIAIYARRERCPRRLFVAVMMVADLFNQDSLAYRALRSSVMARGK